MAAPLTTRLADSFRNLVSGLGVFGRDKAVHTKAYINALDRGQLEALYRGDWVSRKLVTIPAKDSVREWRAWQADPDQIKQLEETERLFGIQRKVLEGLVKARLYGGAALILGVDQGRPNEPLDLDRVQKGGLKFVHVVTQYGLVAGELVREITSPYYGVPSYYQRSYVPISTPPGNVKIDLGEPQSNGELYIHPSRVVRLVGIEYPDLDNAPDGWGDSVLQPVFDAVRDAGAVPQAVAAMIQEAKLDIISVPGLTETLSTEAGTQKLINRFGQANVAKSIINTLLLDADEKWDRRELSMTNLDKVLMMYLLIACAAADIPSTRFLSREPAGMNATGDSDLRNYYDSVASDRAIQLQPALSHLDEVLIRSTLGARDPDIYYNWNPLWQLGDTEKSEIEFRKAQAHKIDVDTGLIDPDVLRRAREASLSESGWLYPGIDGILRDAEEEGRAMEHPDREEAEQQELEAMRQRLSVNQEFADPGEADPRRRAAGE